MQPVEHVLQRRLIYYWLRLSLNSVFLRHIPNGFIALVLFKKTVQNISISWLKAQLYFRVGMEWQDRNLTFIKRTFLPMAILFHMGQLVKDWSLSITHKFIFIREINEKMSFIIFATICSFSPSTSSFSYL